MSSDHFPHCAAPGAAVDIDTTAELLRHLYALAYPAMSAHDLHAIATASADLAATMGQRAGHVIEGLGELAEATPPTTSFMADLLHQVGALSELSSLAAWDLKKRAAPDTNRPAPTLRDGAQALVHLQSQVCAVAASDDRSNNIDAGIEAHSFGAIDALVLNAIMANVVHADPLQRQGFVRSLSVLLHTLALDGVPEINAAMVGNVLHTLQGTEGAAHG